MPIFTYECTNCKEKQEKFQHKSEEIELKCKKCESICKKTIGMFVNKKLLSAKDKFAEEISPEVDKIRNSIDNGSDKDFFDIYGEN